MLQVPVDGCVLGKESVNIGSLTVPLVCLYSPRNFRSHSGFETEVK